MPPFARWISPPELRLAFRLLRRQPVATITTVLALTVGIGMATTGFTLLDSVLCSKLPFPNGDRFVLLDVYTEPEARRAGLDTARFRLFSEEAAAFEHLGAFHGTEVNLVLPSNEIVPVRAAAVTPDSIRVFGYTPVIGRMLRADDGTPGSAPVMLVRASLWRRHFSADPGIVGSTAVVSGVRRTIVGVMPDEFELPSGEAWLPLVDTVSARTFGILKNDQEPAAAAAQLAALTKQFEAETPGAQKLRIGVLRFTEAMSQGLELLTAVLVGSLVLVLLVIAANIANLVLARTSTRARELAVRTALGATRARLVGQVFVEVLLIGVIAAAIGLTASQAVLAWVRTTLTDMPSWVDFTASPRTMVFVACATLMSAAVGGVLPALKATRRNSADVLASTAQRGSTGFGKLGGSMIALQVALSIALLNGALLMARGVAGYMQPTLLVPAGEVLTARVVTEKTAADAIVKAIAAIPEVRAAGAGSSLPGLSPSAVMTTVEGTDAGSESIARPAPMAEVAAGFFETLGASARAGRLLRPEDFATDAPPVAVVNEPFVAKFLGGMNPLGRRLRMVRPDADGGAQEPWREIVGIVPDLGLSAGDENMAAGFYVPMPEEKVFHIVLRTSGDARRLAGPLRAAIARVDPDIQLRDVIPLQDVGREDRAIFAGIGAALAALGGVALLLSVIGTYATLSLAVTRRTREIGIRAALGASRGQVLRTIIGSTGVPPAIGVVLGMGLGQTLVAARGIFAFRLPDGSGPWGLAVLAAIMIAAGLLSAWIPARRALAVAPAEALRSE
jgi:putative ABC transport system permease protein